MNSLPSLIPTVRARIMKRGSLAFDNEDPSLKQSVAAVATQTRSSHTKEKPCIATSTCPMISNDEEGLSREMEKNNVKVRMNRIIV